MATLIIRLGLIYLLVVLSPVAFACYVLPNTERYFKKWWELLQQTLMIYPIITALFAISIVLAQSTVWSTQSGGFAIGGIGYIVSLLMLVVPLAMIPFAFKMAGGLIGRLHEFVDGARKGLHQSPMMKTRRERAKQRASDTIMQGRERVYDRFNEGGAGRRFLARRIGGHNLKGAMADINARVMKEMQAQNDTGEDTEQRALSVNKKWADEHGVEGTDIKHDADGKKHYRTAGGAWVSEGDVDAAYQRWGHSAAAKQWSLGHEMEKASTQEEQDYLATSWRRLGGEGGSWNLADDQRKGIWKGAGFAKQNINRQWKHYGMDDEGNLVMESGNALNLFREIDEKQGGYAMLQQSADNWTTMIQSMMDAKQLIDEGRGDAQQRAQAMEILKRGARIAAATRSSSMADTVVPGEGETAPPAAVVRGASGRQVGAGAAGRVQEEMIRFVEVADRTAGEYKWPAAAGPNTTPPRLAPGIGDSVARRRDDRSNPANNEPGGTGTGGVGPRIDGF